MGDNVVLSEALTVQDKSGAVYSLQEIPKRGSPLIRQASQEILQEMQVDNIIVNLENVAKLMFVAYNALGGTGVQPQMSGLQMGYLKLIDESGRTIICFRRDSELICNQVLEAYDWLTKGKESMALACFDECAGAAAEMASKAETLAKGFTKLGDQAETILEASQKEQALQYKKMDEMRESLQKYEASLHKCESLRDSLEVDIQSINKIYDDARKKEEEALHTKKALMITQAVLGGINSLIPSVSSLLGTKKDAADGGNSAAVQDTKNSVEENEAKKKELEAALAEKKKALKEKQDALHVLEKEIKAVQNDITVQGQVTASSPQEQQAALGKLNAQLEAKQKEKETLSGEIKTLEDECKEKAGLVQQTSDAINGLNAQLQAWADSCKDDAARAADAADKALETKLAMEKERREMLASIQEFAGMIKLSVEQKSIAETAVKTLLVAIKCIKQVAMALMDAAKFWWSLNEYCKALSDGGIGQQIRKLSKGLDLEERLEYYIQPAFMLSFLQYIGRWAALYYVCDDYHARNEAVRGLVDTNIRSAGTREEEWKLAESLAGELQTSINAQVIQSTAEVNALQAGVNRT